MRSIVLFAAAFFITLPAGYAQGVSPSRSTRSRSDSLRVARYEDSAFRRSLFSYRRQAWLDSALRITPGRAYYWQQKAMPLFKEKKYELGLPYLDSAVKYDVDGQYLEYRAFMKCIFQKSYRSALQDFYAIKALRGNSGVMDHPYDFYIGLCHLQLNNMDSCRQYFTACVERRRKTGGDNAVHYLHWYYLGIACYVQEDYTKAGDCFDKSLQQYSNFSDAKYYRSLCLWHAARLKPALALMLEAQRDLAQGYTINEDNVFYETYPYQVSKVYIDGEVKYMKAAVDAAEQSTKRSRIFISPAGDTMKQYYFVMLKKGPKRSAITDTAVINRIQQGHMDNMTRLAGLGKLRVAGPFDDEGDWRGIFILDCNTRQEAEDLLATDPAIAAGRLAYEIHPWWTKQGTVIR